MTTQVTEDLIAQLLTDFDLTQDGYAVFVGGLTIQWGRTATNSARPDGVPVTFGLEFPNQCFGVIPNLDYSGVNSGTNIAIARNVTTTGFDLAQDWGVAFVSADAFWIAIGH